MKQSTGKGRRAWFWVGVILLSISALWWLLIVGIIVGEPEDAAATIGVGLLLSAVPIGIGIYGLRRGRKVPTVEMEQSPELTYASQPTVKPAKTYTGFSGKLKEKLRDKRREEVCASLCTMGVDARMAERGRREEYIGGDLLYDKRSLGLIEIRGQPVQWVNVLRGTVGGGQSAPFPFYRISYLVSDPSVSSKGYLKAKSVRAKSVPLIGRVVRVWWKGRLYGNLMGRMSDDSQINHMLVTLNRDVTVCSHPRLGCWSITTGRPFPSKEEWDCCMTIARHLLESSAK